MSAIDDEHISLGAYSLGLLQDADKATFEAHLATCAACAAELGTLSPVADLLKGLEPVELPADPGAGGVAVARHGQQAGPVLSGQLHAATDPATGVTGTVGLVAKAWGTQVTLDLADVHGPLECQLIAVSKTGERRVVTGWFVPAPGDGVPGHPAHLLVQGGTSIPLGGLARLEVTVLHGPALLTISV